jgi:hypothetical protein
MQRSSDASVANKARKCGCPSSVSQDVLVIGYTARLVGQVRCGEVGTVFGAEVSRSERSQRATSGCCSG